MELGLTCPPAEAIPNYCQATQDEDHRQGNHGMNRKSWRIWQDLCGKGRVLRDANSF